MYIAIFIICILFMSGTVYLLYEYSNLQKAEMELSTLFKKRNYQVASIYGVSKKYLNKHEDIFKEFINLKKRDFSENIHKLGLKGKLPVYTKIHSEINFIFKICEKHPELNNYGMYNYIKESILEKSKNIGERYEEYEEMKKKFEKIHKIAKIFLIGFFIKT